LIFYVLMSILLIACCGNLTPRAVDLGKGYKYYYSKEVKQSVLALLLGLVSIVPSVKIACRYFNKQSLF